MNMTNSTTKNDDFIQKLAIMTPVEINQLIQDKGKKPRLIPAFCKVICDDEGNPIPLN